MARCTLAIAKEVGVAGALAPLEALLGSVKAAGALAVAQFIETLLGRARFVNGDTTGALALLAPKTEYSVVPRARTHGLAKVWLAEMLCAARRIDEGMAALDAVERGAQERGTLAHCWKARGELARAAGDLVEAEIQYRRSLAQARQLSMMPVCEACEAALAALAALQTGSSVERNVEI